MHKCQGSKVAGVWNCSPPCSADVKNAWSCTSNPTTRLHVVVL